MDRRYFIKTTGIASMAFPLVNFGGLQMKKFATSRSICIFSKHLEWLDYDEAAEVVAAIGFDGIDLTVREGGHVLPARAGEDLKKAAAAFNNHGLEIPMITTNINSVETAHAENILKAAQDIGVLCYRMGYLQYKEGFSIPETLKSYGHRLGKLSSLNRKYGLQGAYQNHSGTFVGGPVWDVWLMIKDLDPSYIGCQYDVRHATVEGGYSWQVGMELLNPWIRSLIIKDFKWIQNEKGTWEAISVPLGEGMVDWESYFKNIKKWKIEGPFSLHYEYPILSKEERSLSRDKKKEKTIQVMKKDLEKLRFWMAEYNL